jgi:hypothetical protein
MSKTQKFTARVFEDNVNYQPFNLEEAKAGHPIITRSGKPVRFLGVKYNRYLHKQQVVIELHNDTYKKWFKFNLNIDGTAGTISNINGEKKHIDGLDLFMDITMYNNPDLYTFKLPQFKR